MVSLRAIGIRFSTQPVKLSRFIRLARCARQQRRRLCKLDKAALRDLGLTRHEALKEARRPFWDVPHNWRM